MEFDFDRMFEEALQAGVTAACPGGAAAERWIRKCAQANEATLRGIVEGVQANEISSEYAALLLRENAKALEAEAATLAVLKKATAQAAVNAFLKTLAQTLSTTLKIPL